MTDETRNTYLVVGPMCWGKGFSKEQAIRAARENLSSRFIGHEPVKAKVFQVTPDTTVNSMGALEWPLDAPVPEEVKEIALHLGKGEPYQDRLEVLYSEVEKLLYNIEGYRQVIVSPEFCSEDVNDADFSVFYQLDELSELIKRTIKAH